MSYFDWIVSDETVVLIPLYLFPQILMGLLRLGFVTIYLSDPLISGFTTGCACHVFTSQIKHVFGVSFGSYSGPFKLVKVSKLFDHFIKSMI